MGKYPKAWVESYIALMNGLGTMGSIAYPSAEVFFDKLNDTWTKFIEADNE